MKKLFFIISFIALSLNLFATPETTSYTYVKKDEGFFIKEQGYGEVGVLLKFGSQFNQSGCGLYDRGFGWGVAAFYDLACFNRNFGFLAGFEGKGVITDGKLSDCNWYGIRAGLRACRYINAGALCGFNTSFDKTSMDWGVYGMLTIPFGKYFGICVDYSWTRKTEHSVSGGIFFTIPTRK